MKDIKLSSNMEDYLEVIAMIKRESGVARVSDIAQKMNVKKPSVNAALRNLTNKDLVIHEKYGYVDLTETGKEIAQKVQKRHDVLRKFFTDILNIDIDTAKEDACRIEHVISSATFKRLTRFIEFIEDSSSDESGDWISDFKDYLKKKGNDRQ